MNNPSDRRHEQRFDINEEVFDAESGKSLGFTLNVNAYGMLLVSKETYDDGDRIRIKVNMSIEDEKPVPLSMIAECRWSSPIPEAKLHQYGFHFNYPNPANIEYTKTLFNAISAS